MAEKTQNKKQSACVGHRSLTGECGMTTYKECNPRTCAFYKTKAEAERDREMSFERRKVIGGPFTEFDDKYMKKTKKGAVV